MAARKLLGIRVSEAGNTKINDIAGKTSSTRSEVGRVLLSEALRSPSVLKAAMARLHAMKDPTE